jgi:hypothetical protein
MSKINYLLFGILGVALLGLLALAGWGMYWALLPTPQYVDIHFTRDSDPSFRVKVTINSRDFIEEVPAKLPLLGDREHTFSVSHADNELRDFIVTVYVDGVWKGSACRCGRYKSIHGTIRKGRVTLQATDPEIQRE